MAITLRDAVILLIAFALGIAVWRIFWGIVSFLTSLIIFLLVVYFLYVLLKAVFK